MKERFCKYCGGPIPPSKHPRTIYCSYKCQQGSNLQKYHDLNPPSPLSPGTIGVIGEYKVTLDLLEKGFEVFRAVSPSCSCDLASLKNNKLYRIEVRTGHYSMAGEVYVTRNHKADILAIVLPTKIIYEPDLP